jgi:hypothetical protein
MLAALILVVEDDVGDLLVGAIGFVRGVGDG